MYDKTITVLNKLKASDSSTKQDIYYKTVLHNCGWYERSIQNVQGTQVSIGSVIKVFIPFDERFLPYEEWKKSSNQLGHYTMSQGDTIILGEVEEEVTPSTITKIKKLYEPNVCEVRHKQVNEAVNGIDLNVQIYVEGV